MTSAATLDIANTSRWYFDELSLCFEFSKPHVEMLRACKVFTSEIASEYACDWQCRERLEGDRSDSTCSTRHILPGTEDQIVPPN